jgi:molecular chaperone GrpE
LQGALAEAQDSLARRQADFDNYRKRIERERGEAHNRIVADVARKLLPVVDNLARALDAERTVENAESKEFRHFLLGVELINKQLTDVLESLGITQIASVGERFDPHVHEAVVTEPSDEYEPDTVTEEITRGYRIGDRLLRPAMVKVAARKQDEG